jgi:lipopolysaccharide/colanic/teichoic acid biosynthesis glycosyltransferase
MGAGELTLPHDTRVLPLGRVLRKTKLNELPQLLNILKGDISIIGPRPQTPKFYLCYRKEDRALISLVRPGLSGVGSILFRNEEELIANVQDPVVFDMEVIMPYKGRIEGWFVTQQSLGLYLELILISIMVVIFPNRGFHRGIMSRLPPPPHLLSNLL